MPGQTFWRPTHAHLRATGFGFALLVLGVALGRPDLVVLAAPLAIVALWSAIDRPSGEPVATSPVRSLTVHEGEEFTWEANVSGGRGVRRVAAVHPRQHWLDVEPENGRVVRASTTSVPTPVRIALRSTRWGRRELGAPAVAAYGAWNAWRWGPVALPPIRLTTLPVTAPIDSVAPAPHPRGLVGMERAARPGEGNEFARVRPFQMGDRLRRIHWPVSARTGLLHVTATYADEDSLVVILVDAVNDIGDSDGLEGARSSMDVAVHAAAAIAEHFLRRGDRVGLRVFGTWGVTRVPASSGRIQLRRILDTLCLIEPGTARGEVALAARQGLGAGTLAIMLSPLVDPAASQQAVMLSRAGLDVVVVDTLPRESRAASEEGDRAALAWRIRLIERRLEVEKVSALGIPVVPWSGPGSLDRVLRDLTRRGAVPRATLR